jgi:uncharacterized DUF497 family protein
VSDALKFEWDRANVAHIGRHKVTAAEAEQALENEPFDASYEVIVGEPRWTSIGHTNNLRVLVLVWTLRKNEIVRVITARDASKTARNLYLRQKGF